MILDLRTVSSGAVVDADVCILGAGAAGITMALHLAATRLRVVVVESGGLAFDREVQALARGEQSGVPYFPLEETRYRVLGGSTFKWGARTAPLTPLDFSRRGWVPHSGWPLSADALTPYYDRVFELIGLHRPFDYDQDVWKAFDRPPPAVDPAVLQYCAFQFGKNLLLGRVHRRALRDAGNVTVYLNANAVDIHTTGGGDHVDRVDVATLAGGRYAVVARAYVLACGGIENARLLLASSSVHPAGVGNQHDVVGRYFMEHPTVGVGTVTSSDLQRLLDVFSPGLVDGHLVDVGLALSPALQEARTCLNAVARVIGVVTQDATQALRELLWQLGRGRLPEELPVRDQLTWFAKRVGLVARDPRGIVANVARHAAGRPKRLTPDSVVVEVRTEQAPNPASRVTLSDARDALGQRRAHLHWELTGADRHTIRVTAEAVAGELRRLGLGRVDPAPWLAARDRAWPADLVGGHHHMGTTRMSEDPRTGVVDADCRVHGMDNCYVAGSSVFPTAGYVNPTASVMALALRLAAHLERRYA